MTTLESRKSSQVSNRTAMTVGVRCLQDKVSYNKVLLDDDFTTI